jgi:Uncharacterized conserved protein
LNIVRRILVFIAATGLLFGSLFFSQLAFDKILDFRKLERIPVTSVLGSTYGEVQLRGYAIEAEQSLTSPMTNTACVYYRYLVEEEYRDRDGNTQWRTLRDETRGLDFYLDDGSGRARLRAADALHTIQWNAPKAFFKETGDHRYTEWRIDNNQWITVFGWMEPELNNPHVNFKTLGEYVPIISSGTAANERSRMGWSALLLLASAIAALVLMCWCVMFCFRLHKILIYLSLTSFCCTGLLFHYGWKSLQEDVLTGYGHYQKQLNRSQTLTQALMANYKLKAIPGFDVNAPPYSTLSTDDKLRANSWRIASHLVRQHYLQQIDRFPENIYARMNNLDTPPPIQLPADQLQIASEQMASFERTKTADNAWLNLVAFAITFFTGWLAFRFIRVKRIQENLPTRKTAGVTCGLTEVTGTLTEEEGKNTLIGPVSNQTCCWFHYTVKERRSSGKNTRWVTIEDRQEKQPFYCKDDEGKIRLFPGKAEIITKHCTSRREGRYRYTEKRLSPGDTLYCLGKAVPDKSRGDTLVLIHDKEAPYIISNRPEHEVMLMKANRGMGMLTVGISAMFLALLIIAGSNGSFSSLDYLMASLAAPFFLSVIMLIIMFNDLIFLRQRCKRSWANIQTSLKKRATLIPQLERVAKALLAHEKGLLTQITQLRSQSMQQQSTNEVDRYMRNEHTFINNLQITLEKYPEINTDKSIQDLHRRIVKLENEIAMIRNGFNDSVTQYNTRIQQFPDVLIAKLFRFTRMSLLDFSTAAHALPEISLDNR